jgi:hypothetical protein
MFVTPSPTSKGKIMKSENNGLRSVHRARSDAEDELWRMIKDRRRGSGFYDVVVPFADKVAILTNPNLIRVRRDFPAVMELTQASAVLNRAQRSTDAEGHIVATIQDYARALSAAFGENPVARAARRAFPSAEAIEAALRSSHGAGGRPS